MPWRTQRREIDALPDALAARQRIGTRGYEQPLEIMISAATRSPYFGECS
jgi:hypothetical protein